MGGLHPKTILSNISGMALLSRCKGDGRKRPGTRCDVAAKSSYIIPTCAGPEGGATKGARSKTQIYHGKPTRAGSPSRRREPIEEGETHGRKKHGTGRELSRFGR